MTGDFFRSVLPENEDEAGLPDIDASVAHIARVYDYWLGGKDHFAADREVGDKVLEIHPETALSVRANRAFLARAVRYLTAQGIRQFLDIGTGLPTVDNTHEVAQAAAPTSMPWALGIWVSVRVSRFWLRRVVSGCGQAESRRVVPADGRFHGPASGGSGPRSGVYAGQAGLLAMVMTASAVRVRVSLRVAWPKLLGDFDLRGRCRFRSVTVRYFPIALVRAL